MLRILPIDNDPLRYFQVQRLLSCMIEYRDIFPVCQPNADVLELQALQQRGGGGGGNNGDGSSGGFDLELDMHHAMDIASRGIWTATTHGMPSERQAAMNAAASLLVRSEMTRAWLVAEGRVGPSVPMPLAHSSPATSSFASTPAALSVSAASPFLGRSPLMR